MDAHNRHRWTLFLLCGPAGITLLMLTDVITDAGVWAFEGGPDFAFRGPQGVALSLIVAVVLGTAFGSVFGFTLAVYEAMAKKRIPPMRLLAVMLLLALPLFSIHNYWSIHERRWVMYPPIMELVVLGCMTIAAVFLAKKPATSTVIHSVEPHRSGCNVPVEEKQAGNDDEM